MIKGEKIMEEMERTISKLTDGSKELVPPHYVDLRRKT
jgi:hypothetical protein